MQLIQQNKDARFAIKGKTDAAAISVFGDKIVLITDKELVCLHTTSGERLWAKSLPEKAATYLARINRHAEKDEFLVFYGFDVPYFEVFDGEGNMLAKQTAQIRYCYASFALTNEHFYLADDYKWQVIDRKSGNIAYEHQFPIPPNEQQYEEYTQPYFSPSGEYLIFVKRKKILCYNPLTGKLIKEVKGVFDGHNGIAAHISSNGKYFLTLHKEEQKVHIYTIPDFKIVKTCVIHSFYSSILSLDCDEKRLLVHFTSPMLAYYDLTKPISKDQEYEWRFQVATGVEQFILHPQKPIFYECGEGRVMPRSLVDFSALEEFNLPNTTINELFYDEKSETLLGCNQYGWNEPAVKFDAKLQASPFIKAIFKGYEAKKRIFYSLNGFYDCKLGEFHPFAAARQGNWITAYNNDFICLNEKGNQVVLIDKNGIEKQKLVLSRKHIPDDYSKVYRIGEEYWGIKNGKKILVYAFDTQMVSEIKSKLSYPTFVLASPNQAYFLLAKEGKIEVFSTQTKKVIYTKDLANLTYIGFAPDNSIVVAVENQLINLTTETGTEVARFEIAHTIACFTFGKEKIFISDDLRNIYEYATTWKSNEKEAENEWTLPADYLQKSDQGLSEMLQKINAKDIPLDKIPDLRKLLLEWEKRKGITDEHYRITAALCENEFSLRHFYAIYNELTNAAMSPDGKYVAIGSFVGEDYEAGGEFMLFETETGRCVNAVQNFDGGFGWPGYANGFQFSPDGKWLGFTYQTNGVGISSPFNPNFRKVENEFYVTDGWSRPPKFRWTEDSKTVCVSLSDGFYACPLGKSDNSYSGNLQFVRTYEVDEHYNLTTPTPFAAQYESLPLPPDFEEESQYVYPQFPKGEKIPGLSPTKRKGAAFPKLLVAPEFPVFEEGKWEWLAAQTNGWIVCPVHLQSHLDKYLHLSFGNRYAWFFRWIPSHLLTIYADWESAVADEKCLLDSKNKAKMAADASPKRKDFFEIIKQSDPKSFFKDMSKKDRKDYPDSIEVPLKNSDCYQAGIYLEANDIKNGKADSLIGKVVFADMEYSRESFGTLINLDKKTGFGTIFRSYKGGGYGTSGGEILRIAEAVMG